jgi:hypothetical protein
MKRNWILLGTLVLLIIPSLACNTLLKNIPGSKAAIPRATITTTSTLTATLATLPGETPSQSILPTNGGASVSGGRYVETHGAVHFSFIPPDGWQPDLSSANPYPEWSDNNPGESGLLSFTPETSTSAHAYAVWEIDALTTYGSFVLESQTVFQPDSGVDAYKLVFTLESSPCVYYIFYQNGNIIEAGFYSAQDAAADQSMMTFQFEE